MLARTKPAATESRPKRVIRVQPLVRYQTQYDGIVLVFSVPDQHTDVVRATQTGSPFEFFAQDLRQHWAHGQTVT